LAGHCFTVRSMTGRDPLLITGAHGFGVSAALVAALGSLGVAIVDIDDEPEQMARRHNAELLDRLDILDMLIGAGAHSSQHSEGFLPTPRRELTFNDTPKPLSKRRARRLRARAAA